LFKYEGNRMATLCCNVIAEKKAPFTALYIYGPAGCGKTAMLNYLESEIYQHDSAITAGRLKASDLNNVDWSDRHDIFRDAKAKDIVMIEDFNLINNDAVFDDINDLVNYMHFEKKKIVITGNKKLDDYTFFSPKLLSRMKWEMYAKITPPAYEDCLNALRETGHTLTQYNPAVLEEIYKAIVKAEGLSLGNILSTFRRVVVRAQMNNIPLSVDYAESVIYDGVEIELLDA